MFPHQTRTYTLYILKMEGRKGRSDPGGRRERMRLKRKDGRGRRCRLNGVIWLHSSFGPCSQHLPIDSSRRGAFQKFSLVFAETRSLLWLTSTLLPRFLSETSSVLDERQTVCGSWILNPEIPKDNYQKHPVSSAVNMMAATYHSKTYKKVISLPKAVDPPRPPC